MFPIGDTDVRGAGVAVVTILIVVANVIVFIFELSLSQSGLENLFTQYGVVPAEIVQGNHLYALVTSMFLHGGWLHIAGNMLFLWVFGDNIEATFGKIGYLVFYFVGGLAASALFVVVNSNGQAPSIGASGAIAAVLGAYVVMYPRSRVRVLIILGFFPLITRVLAILFLGLWFVLQLFNGVASLGAKTAQTGGVAFFAHVGGFVLGLIVGLLFRDRARQLEFDDI